MTSEENQLQHEDKPSTCFDDSSPVNSDPATQDGLTHSFVRLATYPLDRLSRYEATLWRQAYQILFTLRCLDTRKN
jgi:hypothetical protein